MYPDSIVQSFHTYFKTAPTLVLRSPGRINLIGEHTDYNGGFVLPAAIDKAVFFAINVREDDECHFVSYDLNENFQTSLSNLKKNDAYSWANYLMGVIDEVKKAIPDASVLRGINLVFGGNLPNGGGVSSSAAIENGIGFALNQLFNLGLSRMDLVKISQKAENNFVGMKCGVMDMFASMMGKANQVIRIDCRSLEYEYFPFSTDSNTDEVPDYYLVLCNTMVKHSLVDSEYNTRRAECEEGVSILQKYDPSVKLLRDVPFSLLNAHKNEMRSVVFKRCKYVVEEIERVEKACKALKDNDLKEFGKLMYRTHEGLQHEYEVSCAELDFLVDQTYTESGVLGSRMMGGGFGGCTINLVKGDEADGFIERIKEAYQERFNIDMPCYKVVLTNGTEEIAIF